MDAERFEQSLVANPSALIDQLNLVLCAGKLPAAAKTRIMTALAALPTATSTLERAQTAGGADQTEVARQGIQGEDVVMGA